VEPLEAKFPNISPEALSFMKGCLVMEPNSRLDCEELLDHPYLRNFKKTYGPELQAIISKAEKQKQRRGYRTRETRLRNAPTEENVTTLPHLGPQAESMMSPADSKKDPKNKTSKFDHFPSIPR